MISLRVPDGLLERIERDVENNGDHASRADWIVAAIREYEQQRTRIIAERKIADEKILEHQAAELGSAGRGASAESNANN